VEKWSDGKIKDGKFNGFEAFFSTPALQYSNTPRTVLIKAGITHIVKNLNG